MWSSPLAYAQARLQARHGARAPEAVWQPLEATTEFRPFLEQARATALRAWVTNVSPISPPHEVERLLRVELARRTDEVAGWLPKEHRAAIAWTRHLIDLPALHHLLKGGAALPWMLEDEHLKPIAAADPAARATVLTHGDFAPLARGTGDLTARWLTEWQRRLPTLARPAQRGLARLLATVRAHGGAFAPRPAHEPLPARSAWELRRQLERRVVQHFRTGFLAPAAVFAYLLLQALEFERVRGELVSRGLFAREAA
jgi:hypothetical protein